ncbi:MAG: hypothetical protein RR290_00535 [Clostridia bacterium]
MINRKTSHALSLLLNEKESLHLSLTTSNVCSEAWFDFLISNLNAYIGKDFKVPYYITISYIQKDKLYEVDALSNVNTLSEVMNKYGNILEKSTAVRFDIYNSYSKCNTVIVIK